MRKKLKFRDATTGFPLACSRLRDGRVRGHENKTGLETEERKGDPSFFPPPPLLSRPDQAPIFSRAFHLRVIPTI